MSKNTSISLGNYFDQFVQSQIAAGRYKNVSEVIRAALRMLENEESRTMVLRNAIQEGVDSGLINDFNPKANLKNLKAAKKNNGLNTRLLKKAVRDLNSIWVYTFDKWSESRADQYYELIVSTFNNLADNPRIGKKYYEIMDYLYGMKTGRHIVFYRVF